MKTLVHEQYGVMGTVKRYEGMLFVETKDYTRFYTDEEFRNYLVEKKFTVK